MFDKLVDGLFFSFFGLCCFFNGEECNLYFGLDFVVLVGMLIKVLVVGKVIFIGDYFFNGKMVFVDYGQGFISMFCYLLKIDVKFGQQVLCGGVFGKVGVIGRVIGLYMYWNVSLNDV